MVFAIEGMTTEQVLAKLPKLIEAINSLGTGDSREAMRRADHETVLYEIYAPHLIAAGHQAAFETALQSLI